jgi:hypothetical protein
VVDGYQVLPPLCTRAGSSRFPGSSTAGVGASVRDSLPRAFWRAAAAALPLLSPAGIWLDDGCGGRHGAEVHCRYCAVALYHWSRGKPAPLSASLQVTLQLESTLIDCLRGQPPDSFWVGPVDADDFVSLAADLLAMLTRRDSQEALTLADHLAATDWWDDHVLGYQAVTALERQEHAISRLKIVAALTKCLLGPRAFEFFRFHSAGCWEGRACIHSLSCFENSRRNRKASCSSVPNTGQSHWLNKLRR